MSTRLIQVVAFANVASGATVALPHNININDVPKLPDFVATDAANFAVAVTTTQVSVTNNNLANANVNVWLELKHTIPRELSNGVTDLVPQPFVSVGGGANPQVIVEDESVPLPNNPHSTLNFVGSGVNATDAGGGVATINIPGGGLVASIDVQDEGVFVNTFSTLNFTGGGVTATDQGAGIAKIDVPTPTVAVADEATPLGAFTALDFVGDGVQATDAGGGVAQVAVNASVNVADEGVPLAGNPHTQLNFVGGGVTATDAGGGVAQISIPSPPTPAIAVEDEGIALPGTFTTLNFVGNGVTATDAGGGVAQVSIPTGALAVEDEGASLGSFTVLNFVGGGVTATDAGGGVAQVSVPTPTIAVADEGGGLGSFTALNFVGGGVTATNAGGGVAQVSVPSPPTPAITVEDEGVALPGTFTTVNFIGAGVTATDAGGGVANVTVPGGGGPSTTQVFRYTVTGLEGNPFPVVLPAARASVNYNVQCQFGGPQANAFKDYRPLVASFAVGTFNVECGAVPEANDILMFTVEDLT